MLAPSPRDLLEARLWASLNTKEAAQLCGRHRTTWARMERGQSRVDLACFRLVSLLAGELGVIHPAWSGYLIDRNGDLYLPGFAKGYAPADIMRLPWLSQIAAMHQTPLKTPARVVQLRTVVGQAK